ncbi:hypothetical protein TB2_009277 [Malus domestica]
MAKENASSADSASSSSPNLTQGVENNPNQRLCSVLLNKFNYLPWLRAVSLTLGGRSKLGFINGNSEPPESTSQTYDAWHTTDQLVMSWLLNSMEPKLSELFSYLESSLLLWEAVKDMYGNQNNSVRIFQLKKSVASLKQDDHSFVQHLGSMKSMWNELDMYHPHTTNSVVLLKRADEDKVFQLLASLRAEYEDLRSYLLMTQELPSFTIVCHVIQREENRRRVMNVEPKSNSEARVFTTNHKATSDRVLGKKADWKCSYCNMKGHLREKCWILHLELKPKFDKEGRMIEDGKGGVTPKAFHSACSSTDGMANFSTNHVSLINEFAVFLQKKQESTEPDEMTPENPIAMLGKFAGFLADSENTLKGYIPGIISAISTALNANVTHDFWIVDSGATDHITNKPSSLHDFQRTIDPIHVSIANGKEEPILGKGKIRLLSEHTNSTALYVPYFPF